MRTKNGVSTTCLEREVTLCEILDRVLNKGVVVSGELVLAVADIELLYVGVNIVIGSVETLLAAMEKEYSYPTRNISLQNSIETGG